MSNQLATCGDASPTRHPTLTVLEPELAPDPDDSHLNYSWNEDEPAAKNYRALGRLLAGCGDLFRHPGHGNGLVLVFPNGEQATIGRAADLAPVIVDRIALTVYLDGKPKGSKLPATHLNAMLKSESFLGQFSVVDHVTTVPSYLPDFSVAEPGFNHGGPGYQVFYIGEPVRTSDSLARTAAFLDAMDFATPADRTNSVAAALTVALRRHWPGGKPISVVTATKSHSGKDTVILFASGRTKQCSISYQSTDWALERALVGALNHDPDTGVVVIENARIDRKDRPIASAIIERYVTDPEPFLFSTGTGPATRRVNDVVLAISTNFGTVSEDILNRSLPIHLNPTGDVTERSSPIGNPKLEYLPRHRVEIAAEIHGMVKRWREAGRPLDASVRHPFSEWAATIGGILKVNGFTDFLGNYGSRKVADDPIRKGLGLLGAALPDGQWYRPDEWARLTAKLGLIKHIIPAGDRDGAEGHKRGIGVVLSAHRDETFEVETDSEVLRMRLQKKRGRFGSGQVHVRYRFVALDRVNLEEDEE